MKEPWLGFEGWVKLRRVEGKSQVHEMGARTKRLRGRKAVSAPTLCFCDCSARVPYVPHVPRCAMRNTVSVHRSDSDRELRALGNTGYRVPSEAPLLLQERVSIPECLFLPIIILS